MTKAKKTSIRPEPTKTEIVVVCQTCKRASTKFAAYDADLALAEFVKPPKNYYGACNCGRSWSEGIVIRNPDSTEAKLVIRTYERDRLAEQVKERDLKIESYERAMSLLGGSSSRSMWPWLIR